MQKRLMARFLLAYLILTLCISAISSSVYYAQMAAQVIQMKSPGSTDAKSYEYLSVSIPDYLSNVSMRIGSMLVPSIGFFPIADYLLTIGAVVAAAAVFSRGIAAQYRRLCSRAERLGEDGAAAFPAASGNFRELEKTLSGLRGKLEAADAANRKMRSDCDEARRMLEAARARLGVLLEAGVLAEDCAESALLRSAAADIGNARARVSGGAS
jgi:hypothetical protein